MEAPPVRNLNLGSKIGFVIAIQILIMLILVFINFRELHTSHEHLMQAFQSTIPKGITTNRIRTNMLDAIRLLDLAVFSQVDRDSETFVKRSQAAVDLMLDMRKRSAEFITGDGTPEEKAILGELNPLIERFLKEHHDISELAVENTESRASKKRETVALVKLNQIREILNTLLAQQDKEFSRAEADKNMPRIALLQQRCRQLGIVLSGAQELYRLLVAHLLAPFDQKTVFESSRKALNKEIASYLREIESNQDDRDRTVFDHSALARVQNLLVDFQEVAREIEEHSRKSTGTLAIQKILNEATLINDKTNNQIIRFRDLYNNRIEEERVNVQNSYQSARALIIGSTFMGTFISLILSYLLTRSITRPLAEAAAQAKEMARGNLTMRLGLSQKDEVGQLGCAIDTVASALAGVVADIRSVSSQVASSANGLSGISQQLLSRSQEIAQQSSTVASASEQMAMNINTMAAASEEMSMNVASISSASEEMSVNVGTISSAAEETSHNVTNISQSIQTMNGSFRDISLDVAQGSAIASEAMNLASNATTSMKTLDQNAGEINKVTEMIKMIALQTNLLALNATIEATSAGDAGKGFAVVAGEIKELANQSGRAAEDIARKIEIMQSSTREAVTVIQNVATIITEINASAVRVSQSVEKQTQNAGTISQNISQASKGVGDIARSIAEVAKGATDMSRNAGDAASGATDMSRNSSDAASAGKAISASIHNLNHAAGQNTNSAERVNTEAVDLTKIATELQRLVGHFRVD